MLSPQPLCIPLMSNLPDSWNLDNGHRHRQENQKTHLTVATSSPRSLVKTLQNQKIKEDSSRIVEGHQNTRNDQKLKAKAPALLATNYMIYHYTYIKYISILCLKLADYFRVPILSHENCKSGKPSNVCSSCR